MAKIKGFVAGLFLSFVNTLKPVYIESWLSRNPASVELK
jgi:hypothetical protein